MKIKMIKPHSEYAKGEHEVSDERANYLILVGAAEKVTNKKKVDLPKEKTHSKKK